MYDCPVPPVEPIYKTTSHTFHLLLSCITFGMWALFVWWWWAPAQARSNTKKRIKYQREMARYHQARAVWDSQHQYPRSA